MNPGTALVVVTGCMFGAFVRAATGFGGSILSLGTETVEPSDGRNSGDDLRQGPMMSNVRVKLGMFNDVNRDVPPKTSQNCCLVWENLENWTLWNTEAYFLGAALCDGISGGFIPKHPTQHGACEQKSPETCRHLALGDPSGRDLLRFVLVYSFCGQFQVAPDLDPWEHES